MEKVTLSLQLVNQIMGYLGSQPYGNVFQLIDAIQKEAQPQQPAEKVEAEPVN